MPFSVLSQSDLRHDMLRQLQDETLVGLVGLPGSGKSHVCDGLIQSWAAMDRSVICAPGDEYQRARRYFPFQQAISQSGAMKQVLLKGASGAVVKGATSIPVAGPLAGFIIERLLTHDAELAKERVQFLLPEEQNILYHLQRIADHKPLLVVCDDLQFWDESALSLLRLMLSGRINAAYPFLLDARYVIVQTVRAIDEPPPIDFSSLCTEPVSVNHVEYANESELPKVLGILGLSNQFPAEVMKAVHGICGGHLHVLKQLVGYLRTNKISVGDDLALSAGAELVSRLVTSRLKTLGPVGDDLLDVLKTASIIGTIFSDQELACLCERKPADVRKLLSTGEDMYLVRRGTHATHFAHGIVHQSIREVDKLRSEELHAQFSACLKKLRPGDYRSRMKHLEAAGDLEGAGTMAVCGLLQDRRKGAASLDEGTLRALAGAVGLTAVLDLLLRAQDKVAAYDLRGALSLLVGIDPRVPLNIQAETAYIRAVCLIKEYQYDAREEAIKALQKWIDKLPEEGDLVVRMLSTQLVALAHQRRDEEALDAEREIVEALARRVSFDPDALDALMVLDRKADLLYPADLSHERLMRARNHFMPSPGGQPRDFYQYCASTLNLAANRLVCANYDTALMYLRELASFLDQRPGHRFTRYEVLTNNVIVCELLDGICDAETAADNFERLTASGIDTMDFALVQSNLGASAAMAGDFVRARAVLEPLVLRLRGNPEADDLHVYLAGTNLASALYLDGERASALELSRSLADIVETANPPHRAYFRDRHVILERAMESGQPATLAQWDALPAQASQSGPGPCWRHYGRGFLFTDLQIFTES